MSDKDKEKPFVKLSDAELKRIFAQDDEKPDVVKTVSEAFARVLDEVPGKDYMPPAKREEGDRDKLRMKMSDKDKEKPFVKLSDAELKRIIGRRDEKPDVVKTASEAFARVLDEVLGKDYVPPAKREEGDRDS